MPVLSTSRTFGARHADVSAPDTGVMFRDEVEEVWSTVVGAADDSSQDPAAGVPLLINSTQKPSRHFQVGQTSNNTGGEGQSQIVKDRHSPLLILLTKALKNHKKYNIFEWIILHESDTHTVV